MTKLKVLVDNAIVGNTNRLTNYTKLMQEITENEEGRKIYQGLKKYHSSNEALLASYSEIIDKLSSSVEERFPEIKTHPVFKHLITVLDISTWPSAEEDLVCYGDKAITELSTFLKSLLEQNKCNVENIPAQWDTLKNRVKHTVSGLKDVNYLEVWAKLLTNKSVKEDCSDVLHVIELLLITPFTNAKVERMFSRMNRVKTDWRSSLKRERLDHLLRIGEEGVPLTEFNPESAIDVWNRETVCRIAAAKPHRYPKKRSKIEGTSSCEAVDVSQYMLSDLETDESNSDTET